jgi:hypothetical protein
LKNTVALMLAFLLFFSLFSVLIPKVLAVPTLSNGYVSPSTGDVSTQFSYYVTYYDPGGNPPELATVRIDGNGWSMTLWNGVPSNGVYKYSTTLSVGTHDYCFMFTSGSYTLWLPPPSTPYSGPTVSPLQRRLTVTGGDHDNPNPPNGNWYFNDGQTVWCSVTSPVTESGTTWTCTGWTGTGSVPASGSGPIVSFTITQTSSINWIWQSSVSTYAVTINPNGGRIYVDSTPITNQITYQWTSGSNHQLDPDSGYQPNSGTQLFFTQWNDMNTADPRTITVSGATTYSAQWNMKYLLQINVNPSGGGTTTPATGTYWISSGLSQTVSESSSSGYTFDHWDLDGSNVGIGTSYTLTMNTYHTLTAVFSPIIPDFAISNPGAISVSEAGQATRAITVTSINGYNNKVSLSATGQPTGVSVSFSPVDGTPTFTSTVTVRVNYIAHISTYPITVLGAGTDGKTHSITFSLTVTAGSGTTTATNSVPKQTLKSFGLGTIDLNSKTVSTSGDYQLNEGILSIQDPYTIPLVVTLSAFGYSHTFDVGYMTFSNTIYAWRSAGGESVWILKEGLPGIEQTTSSSGDLLFQINMNILYRFDQLPQGSDSISVILDTDKSLASIPPGLVEHIIQEQLEIAWSDLVTGALLLSDAVPQILADSLPFIQISISHVILSGLFYTTLAAAITLIISVAAFSLMASPANILIISPDGKMVGVSPSGEILNQITGAIYSVNQTNDEKLVWITNCTSGEYQIVVNGTGSGAYHLETSFVNGTYSFSQEFTGITSPGTVSHFVENLEVSATPSGSSYAQEHVDVTRGQKVLCIVLESSATIDGSNFNDSLRELRFNATATSGSEGYCKIIFPKELMNGTFAILLNDTAIPYTKTENTTHLFLHFAYLSNTSRIKLLQTIVGDINGDRTVDVFDILAVKAHWSETPSSPNWAPNVDVNDDGAINVFDILTIKANWGKTW